MKFLVLALCVCAASAASIGAYVPWKGRQQVVKAVPQGAYRAEVTPQQVAQGAYKAVVVPQQVAKAVAQVAYKPEVVPQAVKSVAQAAYNPTPVAEEVVVPVAQVKAAPVPKTVYAEANAAIVRNENDVATDGFNYYFETENGISAQSTGTLKRVDNEDVLVVKGSYQYVDSDGRPVQVTYFADETGYHPESELIPVAPEIPEAIARSLEYIRAHPPAPEN